MIHRLHELLSGQWRLRFVVVLSTLVVIFGFPVSTVHGTVDIPGTDNGEISGTGGTIVYPGPVNIMGPEELVFDWSEEKCETEDIPDIPARAFRDAQGNVQLIASHFINRRMTGSDLDSLVRDCNVIMDSDHDPDPANFNNREWIFAPYTLDGTTVYTLVHNEHVTASWYNSLTLAVSTDSGATFAHAAPPGHLVASIPYPYEDGIEPSGIFGGSNIIYNPADEYYYAMLHLEERGLQQWGVGVMRTQDLADPTSWHAWNGTEFGVRFINPYLEPTADPVMHVCAPVSRDNIGKMTGSLTYNTYFGKFIMVGSEGKWDYGLGRIVYGFYYSLSDDLIHWSPRQLIMEGKPIWAEWLPGDSTDYPSLIDPNDTTRNFEVTDQECYLYFTRWHEGTMYDRDLVRIPIQFTKISTSAFTVNSTGDEPDNNPGDGIPATFGGATTLRSAIMEANARPDPDTLIEIRFDIPGPGPHVIQPAGFLPEITAPVVIDGYTQPGASPNEANFGVTGNAVIKIELDGINSGMAHGLEITCGGCTVRGLAINRFGNAIWIENGGGNVIEGNYIGTDTLGMTSRWGGRIHIENSPDNIFGGLVPAARNIMTGSLIINGPGSGGNKVQGNYFSTDITGVISLDDEGGISISGGAHGNIIGGLAAGNLISGVRTNNAILLDGAGPGTVIQGNKIGPAADWSNLGNSAAGVFIRGNSAGSLIKGNVIAYNSNAGVGLFSDAGTGHAVLGNSIFANGIGLDFNGQCPPPPNDNLDLDSGPNNWQNHPVLTSAASDIGTMTIVQGTLHSTPDSDFRIEFFWSWISSSCGYGEGGHYMGWTNVTTDGSGNAVFNVELPAGVGTMTEVVTATATDAGNNTSEFSQGITPSMIANSADLQLVKSDSPDPVTVGETLTYTLTVRNNGPQTATGVTVIDTLPPGVTYVSSATTTGRITPVGNTIYCNIDSLGNGQQAVITIHVTPESAGIIVNSAAAAAMENDPWTEDNGVSETTTVEGDGGPLPGDANGDGIVNVLDMTKTARIILEFDEETPGADANEDSVVNVLDITRIALIILGLD